MMQHIHRASYRYGSISITSENTGNSIKILIKIIPLNLFKCEQLLYVILR